MSRSSDSLTPKTIPVSASKNGHKHEQELMGDAHFMTGIETPMRENAFSLSDEEKIEIIEEHFEKIMHTLGLDTTDESLSGTPHRVAKMYVQEVFSGLNPANQPDARKFSNKYEYGHMVVEKTSALIHFVSIIFYPLSEKPM